MALRDQPYLPLFIQDFLTDEKLAECSASATGVYIRLMCLMHKSDNYGKILLKEKYKKNDNQIVNFASQIKKQMPYDFQTVTNALVELIDEKVLLMEGDVIIQKRMVKDNALSEKRSVAGKKGGDKSLGKPVFFAQANAQAKLQANTEDEYEIESNSIIEDKKEENPFFEKAKLNFNIPLEECKKMFLEDELHCYRLTKNIGISSEDLIYWLDQYFAEQENKGKLENSILEVKSHFGSWLPIKLKCSGKKEEKVVYD